MAETKKDALAAFDAFVETWAVKYDKAVECLIKDRDALLAFYSFATVRHRTIRAPRDVSQTRPRSP
jgi:putative transposase